MTNDPSYVTDGVNVYEVVRHWLVTNFGLGADWGEVLLRDIRTEQERMLHEIDMLCYADVSRGRA